jgi:hypothetical protein
MPLGLALVRSFELDFAASFLDLATTFALDSGHIGILVRG